MCSGKDAQLGDTCSQLCRVAEVPGSFATRAVVLATLHMTAVHNQCSCQSGAGIRDSSLDIMA